MDSSRREFLGTAALGAGGLVMLTSAATADAVKPDVGNPGPDLARAGSESPRPSTQAESPRPIFFARHPLVHGLVEKGGEPLCLRRLKKTMPPRGLNRIYPCNGIASPSVGIERITAKQRRRIAARGLADFQLGDGGGRSRVVRRHGPAGRYGR